MGACPVTDTAIAVINGQIFAQTVVNLSDTNVVKP